MNKLLKLKKPFLNRIFLIFDDFHGNGQRTVLEIGVCRPFNFCSGCILVGLLIKKFYFVKTPPRLPEHKNMARHLSCVKCAPLRHKTLREFDKNPQYQKLVIIFNKKMLQQLQEAYGFIFEEGLIREIEQAGIPKLVKEGEIILDINDYINAMPLLLEGAVKILREDKEGNELLLYFLERGDTCALTLSCCLGQSKSEIRAVAERDARLIMVPINKMEEWTATYKSWRNFVFESYHVRLTEMLETIDTLAFMNMDERLLRYLQDKAKINQSEELQVTHQQIAYDLNTSRVVISRLLKKLEMEGRIILQRNNIAVIDL